jgi:hypothetical protein
MNIDDSHNSHKINNWRSKLLYNCYTRVQQIFCVSCHWKRNGVWWLEAGGWAQRIQTWIEICCWTSIPHKEAKIDGEKLTTLTNRVMVGEQPAEWFMAKLTNVLWHTEQLEYEYLKDKWLIHSLWRHRLSVAATASLLGIHLHLYLSNRKHPSHRALISIVCHDTTMLPLSMRLMADDTSCMHCHITSRRWIW